MKRLILYIIIIYGVIGAKAEPKYEVRAVWLTTIGGIDWPRSYAHDGLEGSDELR